MGRPVRRDCNLRARASGRAGLTLSNRLAVGVWRGEWRRCWARIVLRRLKPGGSTRGGAEPPETTREPSSEERADMNKTRLLAAALAAASLVTLLPGSARADDAPSPCAALKRIVAAAPGGLAALTPEDGKGVAQPYGDDARCAASQGSYQCTWTPHHDAGSNADALQAVAADIASCLPDATHDQNSPGRQHFYIGDKGKRTGITLTPVASSKLRLAVSGQ